MTPEDEQRLARLEHVLYKYAQWSGIELRELVDEGYLLEGDLDWLSENTALSSDSGGVV